MDVDALQRRQIYIKQSMWFHCEQELHCDAASRMPSTQKVLYNFGMLDGSGQMQWIPNEFKYVWLHLGVFENLSCRFFEDLQFCLVLWLLPVRSRCRFSKDIYPTLYSASSLRVAQWNPIDISFSSAITKRNYGGSYFLLDRQARRRDGPRTAGSFHWLKMRLN